MGYLLTHPLDLIERIINRISRMLRLLPTRRPADWWFETVYTPYHELNWNLSHPARDGLAPNWLLDALWAIPTPVWDYMRRRTGYVFGGMTTPDGKVIRYYLQPDAPPHFSNWPEPF